MAHRVIRDLSAKWSLSAEQQALISNTAKWLGSV